MTNTEKEWFRKIANITTTENEVRVASVSDVAESEAKPLKCKNSRGFSDVAGMDVMKQLITESFVNVLKYQDCAKVFGLTPPSLLFYGPSGCGKTFFAEKIAEEVGINFMKIVPDDIASTLVHGTQERIGEVFRQAVREAPTIIFFDEFDAMVPKRSNDDRNYQNGEVNEFLCQLNNASERMVYVMAATNHPERIDRAVLRSGRIDEMIYIDMPDSRTRECLFRSSLSKLPTDNDIDYERLAEMTIGYNCSDISYIVKMASRSMFNESIKENDKTYRTISQALLEDTISKKSPSVSSRELQEYERIRVDFSPKDSSYNRSKIGFCM